MFNRYKGVKTLGMLAIGNGEECPFCEVIMTKDIKIFDHMLNNHKEKLIENLFYKGEDYATSRDNKKTKKGDKNG
jgi:hypothetical protein|tara:strand:+ start:745 stop:969 length:225 start_codon:yes stop_codon:yes gene_type:complete